MARASTISMVECLRRWPSVPDICEYHIDKIYYWNGEEVAVVFKIIGSHGELIDQFDSYTKAERRICDLLEKSNR